MNDANCYATLGLPGPASLAETKKAFRRLALKHHPDRGGDAKEFLKVQRAFELAMKHVAVDGKTQVAQKRSGASGSYDPFLDPEYENYIFFTPESSKTAGFERHLFANGCGICHGKGMITKLVEPDKGFLGLQERLCKCQKIGVKHSG